MRSAPSPSAFHPPLLKTKPGQLLPTLFPGGYHHLQYPGPKPPSARRQVLNVLSGQIRLTVRVGVYPTGQTGVPALLLLQQTQPPLTKGKSTCGVFRCILYGPPLPFAARGDKQGAAGLMGPGLLHAKQQTLESHTPSGNFQKHTQGNPQSSASPPGPMLPPPASGKWPRASFSNAKAAQAAVTQCAGVKRLCVRASSCPSEKVRFGPRANRKLGLPLRQPMHTQKSKPSGFAQGSWPKKPRCLKAAAAARGLPPSALCHDMGQNPGCLCAVRPAR